MNFTGSTSAEPMMFKNSCIQQESGWTEIPTSGMFSYVHQGLGSLSYNVTSSVEETESSHTMPLSTLTRDIKGKDVESGVPKGKTKKPISPNEGSQISDSRTEVDDASDEATLKKNKTAIQRTSNPLRGSKGIEKTPPVGAKRGNPGSAESWGKTAVRSSKRQFRKTRTAPASGTSSLGNEENSSRICEYFSKNTKTASGAGKKRTRESSPTSDDDVKAAEALFCMSHGKVLPAAGSSVPQDNQIEDEIPLCVINKNPSEFETEQAKKFMWRC